MAETSPLRRRMIEDMTVRNLSPATQRSYVGLLKKSDLPDSVGRGEVRREDADAGIEGAQAA